MSAYISDTSLMTIVETLRDIDQPSAAEEAALEECYRGLEGRPDDAETVTLSLECYNEIMGRLDRLRKLEKVADHIPDSVSTSWKTET